jgi:hypothetical protein
MTSFRGGIPTGLTKTRAAGDVLLGSRQAAAAFTGRHVNTIRRYCPPIACDIGTRALLYDLDAAHEQLATASRLDRRLTLVSPS